MARDIHQAVREVCLWLPEAEEFLSHGSPSFRVRGGKTFAMYAVNHHGDGRVALWLNALPGAQELYVGAQPKHFFVPPYVGPRGWLGVNLNQGIAWKIVAERVREAYERVAPAALRARIGKTPPLEGPDKTPTASEIDPLKSRRALAVLKAFRKICFALPECHEIVQFGYPVWQAGKKSFAWARHDGGRLTLMFWVGVDNQGLLTADARYTVPPYMGHNGWISLDVSEGCDWAEVRTLTLQSYRHFALKRMLLQLPPA